MGGGVSACRRFPSDRRTKRFRVQGLFSTWGCQVQGLGCRVQNLGTAAPVIRVIFVLIRKMLTFGEMMKAGQTRRNA